MFSLSKHFRRLQSRWVLAGVVATVLYVLQVLLKFQLLPGPPWPGPMEAAVLISGANILGYYVAAAVLLDSTYRKSKTAIVAGGILWLLLTAVYVFFSAMYVVVVDGPTDMQVIGYRLRPDVEKLAKSNPSKYTAKELILDFHDPESVWTPFSVGLNRVVLFISWLLSGASLTVTFGAADALSQRKKLRRSRQKKPDG